MKTTPLSQTTLHVDNEIRVQGFVEAVRNQGKMQFLIIKTNEGSLQISHFKSGAQDGIADTIASLSVGSTVDITGKVKADPRVKLGGIELLPKSIKVTSIAQTPLPITRESSLEHQLDNRHLSLRFNENNLLFAVQTTMEQAMREFWIENDFREIHSPKLISTASESGAELFSVPYFNDKTAYLAQSPQFYKQMAMAGGLGRVFEIGPVFRANPSFTSRHDTEFTMVDMEISWIDSHEDVMNLEERWLQHVLKAVAVKHGDDIKKLFGADIVVPSLPFPRVTLEEARRISEEQGHPILHKGDLDPEGERKLSAYIQQKYGHEFVFVTDYPASDRAFYHMRQEHDPRLTKGFDLLWKGLEITTGAQREHRLDRLREQAIERGYNVEPLSHYFGFFAHGCPPHGGCGVGLTRLLMIALNRQNVREVTLLYRGPNRLTP